MPQVEPASNRTPSETEHPEVLSRDEARQGVTGHNVRYVLAFGTLGIIVLFLILLSVYMSGGYGPQ